MVKQLLLQLMICTTIYYSNITLTNTKEDIMDYLAGLGWIRKRNLLVTPDFGSAICMCSVLTNTPLRTVKK